MIPITLGVAWSALFLVSRNEYLRIRHRLDRMGQMSVEGHHLTGCGVEYPSLGFDFQFPRQYMECEAFVNRMVIDHRPRFQDGDHDRDFV